MKVLRALKKVLMRNQGLFCQDLMKDTHSHTHIKSTHGLVLHFIGKGIEKLISENISIFISPEFSSQKTNFCNFLILLLY